MKDSSYGDAEQNTNGEEAVSKTPLASATEPVATPSQIAGESFEQVGSVTAEVPVARPATQHPTSGRSAFFVGAGILISRIIGLVRQRVFAHYFGYSAAADSFSAAFRIPNFLQNVFGEGEISASFIPVYAKLLAKDEREEADRVAGAVFSILALVTSLVVLAGVLAAPVLTDII